MDDHMQSGQMILAEANSCLLERNSKPDIKATPGTLLLNR